MGRILLVSAYVFSICTGQGQALTDDERKLVIDMLEENSNRFLTDIEKISETQWNYKPGPDTWSVAEASEHITLSEGLFLSIAQQSLNSASENEKANALLNKENALIERLKDRTQKAKAPESLKPMGKFATKKELIEAFKIAREKTANYVKTTNDNLKNQVVPHPVFGDLTAYQWLVMIPAHANRHVAQLEEVKTMKDFPPD